MVWRTASQVALATGVGVEPWILQMNQRAAAAQLVLLQILAVGAQTLCKNKGEVTIDCIKAAAARNGTTGKSKAAAAAAAANTEDDQEDDEDEGATAAAVAAAAADGNDEGDAKDAAELAGDSIASAFSGYMLMS